MPLFTFHLQVRCWPDARRMTNQRQCFDCQSDVKHIYHKEQGGLLPFCNWVSFLSSAPFLLICTLCLQVTSPRWYVMPECSPEWHPSDRKVWTDCCSWLCLNCLINCDGAQEDKLLSGKLFELLQLTPFKVCGNRKWVYFVNSVTSWLLGLPWSYMILSCQKSCLAR